VSTKLTPPRLLGGTAAVLAVLAGVAGLTRGNGEGRVDAVALAGEIERQTDHVSAVELAQRIRDREPGLRVIDVRSDSEFDAYHIPSAEHLPLRALATLKPRDGETLVLYSEGGAHAAQGWVFLRSLGHRRVYFLAGGLLDWLEEVMNPALAAHDMASERIAALSRYFGGRPRIGAAAATPDSVGETLSSEVTRIRRRGC
jgi:rhodanese-related sulfurtransferase